MSCIVSELCAANSKDDAEVTTTVGEEEDEYGGAAAEGQFGVLRWWGFEGAEAG